jgi:hypothetical protein
MTVGKLSADDEWLRLQGGQAVYMQLTSGSKASNQVSDAAMMVVMLSRSHAASQRRSPNPHIECITRGSRMPAIAA